MVIFQINLYLYQLPTIYNVGFNTQYYYYLIIRVHEEEDDEEDEDDRMTWQEVSKVKHTSI